jgi:hypothetical protein
LNIEYRQTWFKSRDIELAACATANISAELFKSFYLSIICQWLGELPG